MTGESNTAPLNLDEIPCNEISDPAVMNKHPLVSVKMTTYNHQPYIAQAIEGVLMQETGFPIELVIGEDFSTDRTREIVLEYQRKHPDVIRAVLWNKNVGVHRNSRKLNALLRGKYIAFNEGDDYWIHPKKLQMQVDIMEADPGVGLVHGGADRYDVARERRRHWKPKPGEYDDGDIFRTYLRGEYFVFTPTACVRTDLYHAVMRDNPEAFDGRFLMGDMQLWLELSRITKFRLVNETLATHNLLPESATRSGDVRKEIRFWESSFEMRMHYVRKYNVDRATETHVRVTHARRLLRYAYIASDRELADEAWGELKNHNVRIRLGDLAYYAAVRHGSVRSALRAARGLKNSLGRPRS